MQTNLARSLLFLVLAGLGAGAQETDQEAGNNAVDAQRQAAEIEALEPGLSGAELDQVAAENVDSAVPAAVLAQGVRRRTVSNGVMDEIDLGRTEITGNQELPKVLYIVPWQSSDPGEMAGRPINSLLDEVLAPIDRSEFLRQVDYYGDLNDKQE